MYKHYFGVGEGLTAPNPLHTVRHIGRAALLLAVPLLLMGCWDSARDDNQGNTDEDEQSTPPAEMVDTIAPTAVSNLEAAAIAGGADIALSWSAAVSDTATTVRISWTPTTNESPLSVAYQSGMHSITISGLAFDVEYMFSVVVIDNADTESEVATITQRTLQDATAPAAVSNVTATPLPSGTGVLLRWIDSIRDDVATITIRWSSTVAGVMDSSIMVEVGTQQSTITNLMPITPYTFVITVIDTAGNSTATPATPAPVRTLNPIDTDGDGLIDINSLDRLYNMRYNLDVGAPADATAGTLADDGRYKESTQSADDQGMLCGNDATTPCSGYELTRDLDFTDSSSYASGEINTAWRPTGGDPDTATNAGWEPIGSCNANTDTAPAVCGDDDDTPFAASFEGNGYTISNLYARNTNNGTGTAIGLFAAINSAAAINSIGVVNAFVYGGNAVADNVGGLVGFSNGGSITASYASGSTANGMAGNNDHIGGLVGQNIGTITASYATGSMVNGGAGATDRVGGMVGLNNGTISASYATDSTADGGIGITDRVGGLVGINIGSITASYARNSTANDSMGATDSIGGLVGFNGGTISASYATGSTADGGMGNADSVGGLAGNNAATIRASYAIGALSGGSGTNDIVGGLVGDNSEGTVTASYGVGTITNAEKMGVHGSADLPSGITITGAAELIAAAAAAVQWNSAAQHSQGAWHFGTTIQPPTLQYADYDGAGDTFGCGSDSMATAVIPDSVPNGMGGTITVSCGTTLLPGQS